VGYPVNHVNILNSRRVVKRNLAQKSGFLIASKLEELAHSVDNLTETFNHVNTQMSHNVPAVTDVFLRPIRKNAKRFYGRKKMWRSKTTQRA